MTLGKAGLVTAGLVGVVALGVVAAPTIRDNWSKMKGSEAVATAPAVESSASTPAKTERPARRAKPSSSSRTGDVVATKKEPNTVRGIAISLLWEPQMQDRVKAVLNPGSRPDLAAADFENAEQFMTVAHAARNTQVPFMVLKHRVLNQGQSLAEAIHEFKPALNAKAEVTRARAEARADLEIKG